MLGRELACPQADRVPLVVLLQRRRPLVESTGPAKPRLVPFSDSPLISPPHSSHRATLLIGMVSALSSLSSSAVNSARSIISPRLCKPSSPPPTVVPAPLPHSSQRHSSQRAQPSSAAATSPKRPYQFGSHSILQQKWHGLKGDVALAQMFAACKQRNAFAVCGQESWRTGSELFEQDGFTFLGVAPGQQLSRRGSCGVSITLSQRASAAWKRANREQHVDLGAAC